MAANSDAESVGGESEHSQSMYGFEFEQTAREFGWVSDRQDGDEISLNFGRAVTKVIFSFS